MFKYEYYLSNNEIFEENYSLFYSSIRNNIKETTIIICDNDNNDNNNVNDLYTSFCIPNLFTDIIGTPSFSSFIDEEQPDERSSKLLKKIKLEILYTKKENKPYLLSSFLKSKNYTYKQIENITKQIINQINFLEKNNLTFLKIDLNDILIIENENEIKCAIINSSNLIQIFLDTAKQERDNKLIHIDYPFDKIFFMSPELKNIFEIPAFISHTSIYYNIGSLILFIYLQSIKKKNKDNNKVEAFFGEQSMKKNEIAGYDNEITEYDNEITKYDNDNLNYYLNNELININNTKLFWFIKKSMIKNENGERFLKYL